jgi:LytS/YehU family sensor histidine kinase
MLRGRGGVGLANTQARLQQLYGAEASLELRSRADAAGVEVRIELPVRAAISAEPPRAAASDAGSPPVVH